MYECKSSWQLQQKEQRVLWVVVDTNTNSSFIMIIDQRLKFYNHTTPRYRSWRRANVKPAYWAIDHCLNQWATRITKRVPLLTNSKKGGGGTNFDRRPSTTECSLKLCGSHPIAPENAATTLTLQGCAAQLVSLPIVKVVVLIFTVAAVSMILYIFFLRHRCCLILIRHLQPGSERPPRATDCFKIPCCYWLRALWSSASCPKGTRSHWRGEFSRDCFILRRCLLTCAVKYCTYCVFISYCTFFLSCF